MNKFYPKNKLFYISFHIKLETTTFEGLIKLKNCYTSIDYLNLSSKFIRKGSLYVLDRKG